MVVNRKPHKLYIDLWKLYYCRESKKKILAVLFLELMLSFILSCSYSFIDLNLCFLSSYWLTKAFQYFSSLHICFVECVVDCIHHVNEITIRLTWTVSICINWLKGVSSDGRECQNGGRDIEARLWGQLWVYQRQKDCCSSVSLRNWSLPALCWLPETFSSRFSDLHSRTNLVQVSVAKLLLLHQSKALL